MRRLTPFFCLLVATTSFAQTQSSTAADPFVSVNVPVFVLNHVRVVDGTGTMAKEDQAGSSQMGRSGPSLSRAAQTVWVSAVRFRSIPQIAAVIVSAGSCRRTKL